MISLAVWIKSHNPMWLLGHTYFIDPFTYEALVCQIRKTARLKGGRQ